MNFEINAHERQFRLTKHSERADGQKAMKVLRFFYLVGVRSKQTLLPVLFTFNDRVSYLDSIASLQANKLSKQLDTSNFAEPFVSPMDPDIGIAYS